MFPQPMSRPEFSPDDLSADPTTILEQHLLAGFPPDLALDLVLNELVVRAAEATRATAAALALTRGHEMVCRAATGPLAPDLGVPLNTRDGLSGACLQTCQPQLSVDTEFDPRIDPVVSRRLGIRSILIVPIFDARDHAQFAGILEVFSSSPAAFSHNDQKLLEGLADECARIQQAATEIGQRKPSLVAPSPVVAVKVGASPAVASKVDLPEILPPELAVSLQPSAFSPAATGPRPVHRPPYEAWALVLGALTILAAVAISFLIGSRIGWLNSAGNAVSRQISHLPDATSAPANSARSAATRPGGSRATTTKPATAANADELVVYEKGKVVFRMKPAVKKPERAKHAQADADAGRQDGDAIVEASSTTKIAAPPSVWLSPAQADARLLSRTEPQYPPEALASHRDGNVVLEVQISEDGSVSSIRAVSGDPSLAAAAADAVRNWRYQPYRRHDRPSPFQTDVTLSFTLPD